MFSSQATTFLTEDEERLKDFKLRLQVLERIFNFLKNSSLFLGFYLVSESDFGLFQYLARGVTGYIGKLREFLKTAGTKVS